MLAQVINFRFASVGDIIPYDSRSHHHKSQDIETFLPGFLFYQISRLPLFSFMAYAYFQKKVM